MFSRRTLVTSSAASTLLLPAIRSGSVMAQTPIADSDSTIEIQGAAVDAGRSRVIPGPGLVHQPTDPVVAAEDAYIGRGADNFSNMMISSGVLFLYGAADDQKLVIAVDAATGEELWRQEVVFTAFGVGGNVAVFNVETPTGPMDSDLTAVEIHTGAILWSEPAHSSPSGVVVDSATMVYVHAPDANSILASRNLETGEVNWERDVTSSVPWTKDLITAGEGVVLMPEDNFDAFSKLHAWSIESGEWLWTAERDTFLSIPTIAGGLVWVVTSQGLETLDPQTGEAVDLIDLEVMEPSIADGLWVLGITENSAVIAAREFIQSKALDGSFETWVRPREQTRTSGPTLIANDMVLSLEDSTDDAFESFAVIRGYGISTGQVELEILPSEPDVEINHFLVGDDRLYIGTATGCQTWVPGEEPLAKLPNPYNDNAYADPQYGLKYSWNTDWAAVTRPIDETNGLTFMHTGNGATAAQYMTKYVSEFSTFDDTPHKSFEVIPGSVLSVKEQNPPPFDFIPADAVVKMGIYETNYQAPNDFMTGLRVIIDTAGSENLVFEFIQASSNFRAGMESFATFFENLTLE